MVDVEFIQFVVKGSLRKRNNLWARNVLQRLFQDVDNKVSSSTRLKYLIGTDDEYNSKYWYWIDQKFRKFHMKFKGIHADYIKKTKRTFRKIEIE